MEIIIKIKDQETIDFYKNVDLDIILSDFINHTRSWFENSDLEIKVNMEDD